MRLQLAMVGLVLMGCASAIPTATGASTTPKSRSDLGGGVAFRVPTGDLRDDEATESRVADAALAGGAVPFAYTRRGLTRHLDIGLMVSGTTIRAEVRGERGVSEGSTRPAWTWAIAPYVGPTIEDDDSGRGVRFGLDVPIAYGIDFGGLYDFWIGFRGMVEGLTGDFTRVDREQSAWVVAMRGGAMIGLAAGFRRVHAFVEVTVAWEQQWGEHGDLELDRGGVVLIPAAGLRIRI